jgi:hypothetical protein
VCQAGRKQRVAWCAPAARCKGATVELLLLACCTDGKSRVPVCVHCLCLVHQSAIHVSLPVANGACAVPRGDLAAQGASNCSPVSPSSIKPAVAGWDDVLSCNVSVAHA